MNRQTLEYLTFVNSLTALFLGIAVIIIDIRFLGLPLEVSVGLFLNTILFTGLIGVIFVQALRRKNDERNKDD